MSPSTSIAPETSTVDLDALDKLVLGDWHVAIPPAFMVGVARGALADASSYVQPVGHAPEGPQSFVSIGPGRVRVGRVDHARLNRREERHGAAWSKGYAVDAEECVRVPAVFGPDGHNRPERWLDDQSPRPIGSHAKLMREQAGWVSGEAVRHAAEVLARACVIGFDQVPEPAAEPLGRFESRARITEWSHQSRSNMVDRIATLDFEPFFRDGVPAMVTPTLPDQWVPIAPTGKAWKRLIGNFVKRYERAWERRLRALWKLEFQGRGAPHEHLLMVPPRGTTDGRTWRQWFAATWADIVVDAWVDAVHGGAWIGWCGDSELGCELRELGAACERCDMWDAVYAVHENRKQSANYQEGLKASDPKRISVYFSKHSTKASGSKEYQHIVPFAWQGEGEGPGRFWGYWGLERGDLSTHVTHREADAIKRTLRRWDNAKGGTRRAAVDRVDRSTGVVRQRTVRRRTVRMRGAGPSAGGYIVVNDGPSVGFMLAEVIRARPRPAFLDRMDALRKRRLERSSSAATSPRRLPLDPANAGLTGHTQPEG